MRRTLASAIGCAAVAASISALPGQTVPAGLSLGATAGYTVLDGDDFRDGNGGPRFEGALRFASRGAFAIALGGLYGSHRVSGQTQKITFTGVFIEPRLLVRLQPTAVALFAGARGAGLRQSTSAGGITGTANGFAIGGTGGILFAIGRRVGFETGAAVNVMSFGDQRLNGATVPNTSTRGMTIGLNAGLVVSFSGS